MIMTGDDWNTCHGEIFQIYRATGSGQVRAGDLVGLHYPNTPGKWLGCPKGCGADFMSRSSNHCTWICYTGQLVQMLGWSLQDLCQWQGQGRCHQFWWWHHALLHTRGELGGPTRHWEHWQISLPRNCSSTSTIEDWCVPIWNFQSLEKAYSLSYKLHYLIFWPLDGICI